MTRKKEAVKTVNYNTFIFFDNLIIHGYQSHEGYVEYPMTFDMCIYKGVPYGDGRINLIVTDDGEPTFNVIPNWRQLPPPASDQEGEAIFFMIQNAFNKALWEQYNIKLPPKNKNRHSDL